MRRIIPQAAAIPGSFAMLTANPARRAPGRHPGLRRPGFGRPAVGTGERAVPLRWQRCRWRDRPRDPRLPERCRAVPGSSPARCSPRAAQCRRRAVPPRRDRCRWCDRPEARDAATVASGAKHQGRRSAATGGRSRPRPRTGPPPVQVVQVVQAKSQCLLYGRALANEPGPPPSGPLPVSLPRAHATHANLGLRL
jgi:hypothetical protein